MIRRGYQWLSAWLARPFVPGAPALWAFPLMLTVAFAWLVDSGAPGPWPALTAVAVVALALLVAAGVRRVARQWRLASAAVFALWMVASAVVAIGAVVAIARIAYGYFTGEIWAIEGWEAYDRLAQYAGVVALAVAAFLGEVSARQAFNVADAVWDGRAFAPARQYPPAEPGLAEADADAGDGAQRSDDSPAATDAT